MRGEAEGGRWFRSRISWRIRDVRFLAGSQARQTMNVFPPFLFSPLFASSKEKQGLKTTTPPAHRTFSCEPGWCSQDEPAPSYSLLRAYCGFLFSPRFISLARRPARFLPNSPSILPLPSSPLCSSFSSTNGMMAPRCSERSFPSHKFSRVR